jgi:hypothetical protein
MSLRTLSVVKASAPSVGDLTKMWRSWTSNQRRGKAHGDIAETYIRAKARSLSNPVQEAVDEADRRGAYFKKALQRPCLQPPRCSEHYSF